MADFCLSIAGFAISIFNRSSCKVCLEEGYTSFVAQNIPQRPSAIVNVHAGIPLDLEASRESIYKADFEGNRLWQISKIADGFRFHVFSPTEPYRLQQVADLNADLTEWNIYSEPVSKDGVETLVPLLYPMGPLLMYYLTVQFDSILIHGSGIANQGKGRIFTGVSGKGKTTMAKLWFETGAQVLNDDRLLIVKSDCGYKIHNTPMFYSDIPRSATLNAIYIIYHCTENRIERLDGAEAVSAVMANLIQHGYSSEVIEKHLSFVTEMVDAMSVYRLGVIPTTDVVSFIENNDE